MSAVLLQNEETHNYASTKQHDKNTEHRTCKVRFDNPVYIQSNSTGQNQSVFWYPYSSDMNVSENGNLAEQSVDQVNNQRNVTFSSFKSTENHKTIKTVD